MDNSQIYRSIYSLMDKEKAVLVYSGDFDQEIIKAMLSYTETKLISHGENDMVRKKIFNVMTEMLQNITKHQFNVENQEGLKPLFVLGETDSTYFLITANLISSDKIPGLEEKLLHINSLDEAGLKDLYKESRLRSTISEVGGAGLGFIDIVRKSGNPSEFNFYELGIENSKVFSYKSIISKI